jgi:hypothetical protein
LKESVDFCGDYGRGRFTSISTPEVEAHVYNPGKIPGWNYRGIKNVVRPHLAGHHRLPVPHDGVPRRGAVGGRRRASRPAVAEAARQHLDAGRRGGNPSARGGLLLADSLVGRQVRSAAY